MVHKIHDDMSHYRVSYDGIHGKPKAMQLENYLNRNKFELDWENFKEVCNGHKEVTIWRNPRTEDSIERYGKNLVYTEFHEERNVRWLLTNY